MNWFRKLIDSINKYPFTRNLVLALCAVTVLVFLSSVLLNIFTRHNVHKTVPDFRSMTIDNAKRAARKASVSIEINDSLYIPAYEPGMVLDQQPVAGTKVKPGRRIFLTINSAQRKQVELPYVAGYSLRQAKNVLEMAGLEIARLTYRGDIATNNVLEQFYDGKKIDSSTKMTVEAGSGVTLVIGLGAGAAAPTVPKLIGFPLKEAKSRIWEAGLNVGKVTFDDGINLLNQNQAKVWSQAPDYPRRVGYGSSVDLKLTIDEDKIDRGSRQADRQARSVAQEQQAEDEAATAEDVIERALKGE